MACRYIQYVLFPKEHRELDGTNKQLELCEFAMKKSNAISLQYMYKLEKYCQNTDLTQKDFVGVLRAFEVTVLCGIIT